MSLPDWLRERVAFTQMRLERNSHKVPLSNAKSTLRLVKSALYSQV